MTSNGDKILQQILMCMHVCRVFPQHQVMLWCQLVSPVQLSSDRWGAQSHKTAPSSDANYQVQVLPLLLTERLYVTGSHDPLLGFDYFVRVAHRTRETNLFTRFTIKDFTVYEINLQMKRYIEKGHKWKSFCPGGGVLEHHGSPAWKLSKL